MEQYFRLRSSKVPVFFWCVREDKGSTEYEAQPDRLSYHKTNEHHADKEFRGQAKLFVIMHLVLLCWCTFTAENEISPPLLEVLCHTSSTKTAAHYLCVPDKILLHMYVKHTNSSIAVRRVRTFPARSNSQKHTTLSSFTAVLLSVQQYHPATRTQLFVVLRYYCYCCLYVWVHTVSLPLLCVWSKSVDTACDLRWSEPKCSAMTDACFLMSYMRELMFSKKK